METGRMLEKKRGRAPAARVFQWRVMGSDSDDVLQ
jgi:hypothetical protein